MSTSIVAKTGVPKSFSGVPFDRRSLNRAEAHVDSMLARIEAAHKAGKRKRAEQLGVMYLRSFDAAQIAVLRAYKSLKQHRRPDRKLLPSLAKNLAAWAGTREDVLLILKEKAPGQYRNIKRFGIENRALQYLVLPLLKVQSDLHTDQFGTLGHHAALERVAKLMVEGNTWAIETDIKHCYESFDGKRIEGLLPVPKKVTQKVLCCASLQLSLGDFSFFGPADDGVNDEDVFPALFAAARQGIPQGSAASGIVAEILLSRIFDQLPTFGKVVNYADNTLMMGKSKDEAVAMMLALRSSLKEHPAGQLRPNEPIEFESGQPIHYLGHRLSLHGEKVCLEPTPENLERYRMTVGRGLTRIADAKSLSQRARRFRHLKRYVRSWCAAFKLWEGAPAQRAKDFNRIHTLASGK